MFGKTTKSFASVVAASLTFGLALQAQADTATYLTDDASHCEIFRSISDVIPGECALNAAMDTRGLGKPRGIVFPGEPAAQPETVVQSNPPKDLAIAMRAEFAFDSYELTAETKQVLDRVAAVLADDLMANKRILIEGHADASGSVAYNLQLSKKRARAVTEYLVSVHKINSARLVYAGRGEAALYDPNNPNSGINRRAEFRNLGEI